jgi:protocatechuate 3,4-dioxygenase alpha subunit
MSPDRLCCIPSQTIGPFFHFALTPDAALGCMARPEARGERIRVRLRLLDGDRTPVTDAMIELWQADASGNYHHPADGQGDDPDPAFRGFGRLPTDEDGVCVFVTIRPGRVPAGAGWQASHVNVSIFARGLLDRLCTRLYFAGDPALAEDPVLTQVPSGRRHTLIAQRDEDDQSRWNLEIVLQGDGETVFFEI